MELEAVQKADCILTVSDQMTELLKNKYHLLNVKTVLNGFDELDFSEQPKLEFDANDKIVFVFTGTLYQNIDSVFAPFCEALQRIKMNDTKLYSKLSFEFYGSSAPANIELSKKHNLDIVKFYKPLPLNQVFAKISNADYCMLFLNDVYSFSLSTKFCEYVGLRKPIVLFSKKGVASDFIESNQLGFWISPENTYEQLLDLIQYKKQISVTEQTEFVRERYSIKTIVKELNDNVLI